MSKHSITKSISNKFDRIVNKFITGSSLKLLNENFNNLMSIIGSNFPERYDDFANAIFDSLPKKFTTRNFNKCINALQVIEPQMIRYHKTKKLGKTILVIHPDLLKIISSHFLVTMEEILEWMRTKGYDILDLKECDYISEEVRIMLFVFAKGKCFLKNKKRVYANLYSGQKKRIKKFITSMDSLINEGYKRLLDPLSHNRVLSKRLVYTMLKGEGYELKKSVRVRDMLNVEYGSTKPHENTDNKGFDSDEEIISIKGLKKDKTRTYHKNKDIQNILKSEDKDVDMEIDIVEKIIDKKPSIRRKRKRRSTEGSIKRRNMKERRRGRESRRGRRGRESRESRESPIIKKELNKSGKSGNKDRGRDMISRPRSIPTEGMSKSIRIRVRRNRNKRRRSSSNILDVTSKLFKTIGTFIGFD